MMCEKCWADASLRTKDYLSLSQADTYREILKERELEPCSPQEQAGQFWDEELQRDRRKEQEK